jgi:hypothetical protein
MPDREDVAEDRVQRLHDVRALGGGSGDLLGRRVARGSQESAGVGVERVGDVNEDLAGQRIALVRDYGNHAGVRDGHDDDVTQRRCAVRAGGGSVADLVGECLSLGGAAADELDGVAVFRRPGADGDGHVARADDADGGNDVCSSVVSGSVGSDGLAGVMGCVESVGCAVASELFDRYRMERENLTRRISEDTMQSLLAWSIRFVEDFSADILAAHAEYLILRSRSPEARRAAGQVTRPPAGQIEIGMTRWLEHLRAADGRLPGQRDPIRTEAPDWWWCCH